MDDLFSDTLEMRSCGTSIISSVEMYVSVSRPDVPPQHRFPHLGTRTAKLDGDLHASMVPAEAGRALTLEAGKTVRTQRHPCNNRLSHSPHKKRARRDPTNLGNQEWNTPAE